MINHRKNRKIAKIAKFRWNFAIFGLYSMDFSKNPTPVWNFSEIVPGTRLRDKNRRNFADFCNLRSSRKSHLAKIAIFLEKSRFWVYTARGTGSTPYSVDSFDRNFCGQISLRRKGSALNPARLAVFFRDFSTKNREINLDSVGDWLCSWSFAPTVKRGPDLTLDFWVNRKICGFSKIFHKKFLKMIFGKLFLEKTRLPCHQKSTKPKIKNLLNSTSK